jgi:hypothetical protein
VAAVVAVPYLLLSLVVLVRGLGEIAARPELWSGWHRAPMPAASGARSLPGSAGVPEARARHERLRDRRLGDAPDRRRLVRYTVAARGPAALGRIRNTQAPRGGGSDHERDARARKRGDDPVDLARGLSRRAGERARSPTSPTGSFNAGFASIYDL